MLKHKQISFLKEKNKKLFFSKKLLGSKIKIVYLDFRTEKKFTFKSFTCFVDKIIYSSIKISLFLFQKIKNSIIKKKINIFSYNIIRVEILKKSAIKRKNLFDKNNILVQSRKNIY
jgi:ribosomal protein L19